MREVRISLALALALSSACSSGGTDDSAADAPTASYEQGRRAECHGLTLGFERCALATSTYEAECIENFKPIGVRGSALEAVGKCLQNDDCNSLGSDDPTDACFKQVEASEPLREEVVDYCESASLAWFRCDVWWPVEECATTMSLWEDDVLEHARACHLVGCKDLQACEDPIFHPMP